MVPTCTAHACYLRWIADNMETIPVLEPAQVSTNERERDIVRMRFADGSVLTVITANDGVNLFWEPAQ